MVIVLMISTVKRIISKWETSLFFWLHWGVCCSTCGALFSAECRLLVLWHTGFFSLQCASSLVAMHGFCCPMACGILVPPPGIEPMSPTLQGRFLTTGPPGKCP